MDIRYPIYSETRSVSFSVPDTVADVFGCIFFGNQVPHVSVRESSPGVRFRGQAAKKRVPVVRESLGILEN